MGEKPEPKCDYSIDRIDNNLGYSKQNCRWATHMTQSNNTKQNSIIDIEGDRLTLAEWSRRSGTPKSTIRHRLKRGVNSKIAVFGLD
jgi:hypothetical protein